MIFIIVAVVVFGAGGLFGYVYVENEKKKKSAMVHVGDGNGLDEEAATVELASRAKSGRPAISAKDEEQQQQMEQQMPVSSPVQPKTVAAAGTLESRIKPTPATGGGADATATAVIDVDAAAHQSTTDEVPVELSNLMSALSVKSPGPLVRKPSKLWSKPKALVKAAQEEADADDLNDLFKSLSDKETSDGGNSTRADETPEEAQERRRKRRADREARRIAKAASMRDGGEASPGEGD